MAETETIPQAGGAPAAVDVIPNNTDIKNIYQPAGTLILVNGTVSGLLIDTNTINEVYLIIKEDADSGITVIFDFTLPTSQIVNQQLVFTGRYQGDSTHWIDVYAYNWRNGSYDQISITNNRLNDSSADYTRFFSILASDHINPSNQIRIKLQHNAVAYNASHYLYIDYLAVCYASAETSLNSLNNAVSDLTEVLDNDKKLMVGDSKVQELLFTMADQLEEIRDMLGLIIETNTN